MSRDKVVPIRPVLTEPTWGLIEDAVVPSTLAWLSDRYALVIDGSRTRVWSREANLALGHLEWRMCSIGDLRQYYDACRIHAGRRGQSIVEAWLANPDTPHYRGIAFLPPPTVCPPHVLNLWHGFGVTARAGAWPRLNEHIYEVICAGSASLYDWVMDWFARLVQTPGEPAGSALVLRGDQGAGKGIVLRALGTICGPHYAYLSHAASLTSRFNGQLAGCIYLYADEVVWGGDVQGAGYLKALITEPTISIERKGQEVATFRNCIHVAMSSNARHVAHVEPGDRRYAVLDVSGAHVGHNTDYFQPLYAELAAGGTAAFFAALLARDLAGYDPYIPPSTRARTEQMLRTLDAPHQWLYQKLLSGDLGGGQWPDQIETRLVYDDYIRVQSQRNISRRAAEMEIALLISSLLGWPKRRPFLAGMQTYVYNPAPLREARDAFATALRIPIEWPTTD